MFDSPPPSAMVSPATARNRGPILEALKPRLPPAGVVLEIAAGAGEHAIHMAASLPHLQWLPSDAAPEALASIAAWRERARVPNLLPPTRLDACDPDAWPVTSADAIIAINMIHISPWAATEGLVTGAARLLPSGGGLFLYGPFIEPGVETGFSNLAFDLDLKRRDAAWGLRPLDEVTELAARHGLTLCERVGMRANNLIVVFRKAAVP